MLELIPNDVLVIRNEKPSNNNVDVMAGGIVPVVQIARAKTLAKRNKEGEIVRCGIKRMLLVRVVLRLGSPCSRCILEIRGVGMVIGIVVGIEVVIAPVVVGFRGARDEEEGRVEVRVVGIRGQVGTNPGEWGQGLGRGRQGRGSGHYGGEGKFRGTQAREQEMCVKMEVGRRGMDGERNERRVEWA